MFAPESHVPQILYYVQDALLLLSDPDKTRKDGTLLDGEPSFHSHHNVFHLPLRSLRTTDRRFAVRHDLSLPKVPEFQEPLQTASPRKPEETSSDEVLFRTTARKYRRTIILRYIVVTARSSGTLCAHSFQRKIRNRYSRRRITEIGFSGKHSLQGFVGFETGYSR